MDKSTINPDTGKAYAINPETNVWDDNYWAQVVEPRLKREGKIQTSSGGGMPGGIDLESQRKIALEAVQPAVTSLQASLPEIKTAFGSAKTQVEAEKQPLKDRYDQLLNEIRGRETSQVNDVTRTTNREMARRGITADSTFAAEETQGRTQPIRAAAQSDLTTATLDRETKLREIDNIITNLTTDMVTAERDVQNTIATIQAQAGTDAANRALEMYKVQRQEQENALDRLLQERQVANQEEATKAGIASDTRSFEEQVRQFNVNQANKGSDSITLNTTSISDILNSAGGPIGPTKPAGATSSFVADTNNNSNISALDKRNADLVKQKSITDILGGLGNVNLNYKYGL